MKSFKVLMFLTLAAILSCGANGSPTNITTDDYPTVASAALLIDVMKSLQGIADVYFKQYGNDYAQFNKEYVKRLGWVRPYNYIVCDVDHDSKFDGVEGEDWDHRYMVKPGTQPVKEFDVVVGGSGTFTRNGKGGYDNWAWNGFVVKNQDMKSNVLTFAKPPTGKQAEGGAY